MMKRFKSFIPLLTLILCFQLAQGQTEGIAKSLGLYVFPSEGQDAATQEADEMACFIWAKEQSGYDPLNPTQVVGSQVDRSADGTAIVGAAGGAAG